MVLPLMCVHPAAKWEIIAARSEKEIFMNDLTPVSKKFNFEKGNRAIADLRYG